MRNLGLVLFLLSLPAVSLAETPAEVSAVLQKYCLACHQGEKARGDLRLDNLAGEFSVQGGIWGKVHDRVADGSMPPRGKPPLNEAERQTLIQWIGEGLTRTETARVVAEGRTSLRRLTRREYANTLRDLLGIELDLSRQLPEDPLVNGFAKVAQAQQLSAAHLELYLEGADLALDAALNLPPQPKPTTRRIVPSTPEALRGRGERFPVPGITRGESLILFRNTIGRETARFRTDAAGWYRIRFSVFGHNLDEKPYAVQVETGTTSGAFLFDTFDYYDLPRDGSPRVVEIYKRLPRGATVRTTGYGFARELALKDPSTYTGPGWGLTPIEVEGPLLQDWPPTSRIRLIGNLNLAKGTLADAEAILTNLLPRAFRRPTGPADVAPFVQIVRTRMEKGDKFEPALRAALRAVLCAPEFLFLREKPGPLDDFALASRLSYFLWCSLPDETLFQLAQAGRLRNPAVLREQVERMLRDPGARRFTEDFTDHWLSLRDIDFTTPDKKLYPEYDARLHESMLAETRAYFEQMLKENRPVSEFVASDWAMLNSRLATHYGIPGVTGQPIRKVSLPPGSERGGVLTQAAILKVTANGTTTSPVQRGVWVLDRLLGQPAPPPPGNVPAIEPDTRGATTIRQQLARHRDQESCAGCHRRIDPPGFALEAFDPIGGQRDRYRSTPGPGQHTKDRGQVALPVTNSFISLPLGLPVDQGDVMPDGRRFRNVIEFKQALLADRDQLARNVLEKLTTYATGTPPSRADRKVIDTLVAQTRADGHRFRDLVHALIQSPLFLRK